MKKILFTLLFSLTTLCISQAQSSSTAKVYAERAACALMEKISPHTGRYCDYTINKWEYDGTNKQYIIDFKARWAAKACMLCYERNTCIVEGTLYVVPGESAKFRKLFQNSWANTCMSSHALKNVDLFMLDL